MFRTMASGLILAVACAPAATTTTSPTPSSNVVAAPVTAEELRRDLTVFSADSFRGRETGTPDDLRGARMIAARLQALGVTPAGDSGFYQRVPLTSVSIARSSRVTVTTQTGTTELAIGADVVPITTIGVGPQNPKLSADGDLVFASYGVVDAALKRDDYTGLDLTGKVVVVVADAPPGSDSVLIARYSGQNGLAARMQRLMMSPQRPAAIVLVLPGDKGDELFHLAAGSLLRAVSGRDTTSDVSDAERMFPMVMLARVTPGSALLPSDWPTNDKSRVLTGRRMTAVVRIARDHITSYNVVGIVPGTTNGRTYVALGAHLDHIGVGAPVNGDSIHNGADDDGSGSMALLALARSFAQGPRSARSILFVWHTGEEKGLLGSQHFTNHPTVPIDSIVAQLNADMIGRNHPDTVYIVGPGAAPGGQSKLLGGIVDSVNASMSRPFVFNREWDSPSHPERIYFRSDHYMYAQKRIPIVFFTTGLHADYHKPSDEVSKIDFEKLARIANLMRQTGLAVANRYTRPK